MARTSRLLLDNVCYHVITRGNQRQRIFLEEIDFLRYLEALRKYKKKFKIRIYGYCLMFNHVHLVFDPKLPYALAKAMQGINQSYARYFNHKYKKSGYLWQGRFKSMIINKDQYLMDCINYIELNPIRANMVQSPLDYSWSSYISRTLGIYNDILDQVNF